MKLGFPLLPPGIHKIAMGTFTRNAGGSQSVTGVGFCPKIVIFLAKSTGGTYQIASWGFDTGANRYSLRFIGSSVSALLSPYESAFMAIDPSNYLCGHITSMDADGFTIAWELVGAVTGDVIWLAMR